MVVKKRTSWMCRATASATALALVCTMAPAAAWAGEGAPTGATGLEPAARPSLAQTLAASEPLQQTAVDDTIFGNTTITQSGTYDITYLNGNVITLKGDNLNVRVQGNPSMTYANPSFVVEGENVTLTLENMNISVTRGQTVIDFGNHRGTLNAEGENLVEVEAKESGYPVIRVGAAGAVEFGGSGVFYGYNYTLGCLIGGMAGDDSSQSEPNGAITFVSGAWLLKGNRIGAVVGNDAATPGAPVTVKGGDVVVITKAGGAAVGSSNQGAAGDVVLEGGSLQAFTCAGGSAIGAGADGLGNPAQAGRLIVKGGILRAGLEANAFDSKFAWSSLVQKTGALTYSDAAITAAMTDVYGEAVVPMEIGGFLPGMDDVQVVIDGTTAFEGPLPQFAVSEEANGIVTKEAFGAWESTALPFRVTPRNHAVTINGEEFWVQWNASTQTFSAPLAVGSASLAAATVTGLKDHYVPSTTPTTVTGLTVSLGGTVLKEGTDYVLGYANNEGAGTATVKIIGIGKYCGTVERSFLISATAPGTSGGAGTTAPGGSSTPAPVTPSAPSGSGSAAGAGSASAAGSAAAPAAKPAPKAPTVRFAKATVSKAYGAKAFGLGATVTKGLRASYTSSNKKVAAVSSSGKVTVKGVGQAVITLRTAATASYRAGSVTCTVKVSPAKAAPKLKAAKRGFKVTAKKVAKASGYQVMYSTSKSKLAKGKGTVVKVRKAGALSKTVSRLKAGTTYYVKVRAYALGTTAKGKKTTVYGAWSAVKKVKTK